MRFLRFPSPCRRILAAVGVVACLMATLRAVDAVPDAGLAAAGSAPVTPVGGTEQVLLPFPAQRERVSGFCRLPLAFIRNDGQAAPATRFELRGPGFLGLFQDSGIILMLQAPSQHAREAASPDRGSRSEVHTLRMELVGANATPSIHGEEELPGRYNFLVGNDPSRWHTQVPTFAKVRYPEVYSGIDLVYYGNEGQLEYDFVVAPGADPGQIELAIEGAEAAVVDENGDLRLEVAGRDLVWRKPTLYQVAGGTRIPVTGEYMVRPPTWNAEGDAVQHVGFRVAGYDRQLALVIDPVLAYSTYLGGSFYEWVLGLAVDSEGSAYLTGVTTSSTVASYRFPTTAGVFQRNFPEHERATFVTKLSPAGDRMVYSTVLCGAKQGGQTQASAIAVDASGQALIAGSTFEADLPIVNGLQPQYAGGGDFFLAKLKQDGSGLVFSTYLGGSDYDSGGTWRWYDTVTMAVDGAGDILLAGRTRSTDFPLVHALESTFESETGVIAKVAADGSRLVYSTFLPPDLVAGRPWLLNLCVAADSAGRAYVAGYDSQSVVDHTEVSAPYLLRLNPDGSAWDFKRADVLGASAWVSAIAVDPVGRVLFAGHTYSPGLPTTPGAIQPTFGGGSWDGFLARYNPTTSGLDYLTYLGGSDVEEVASLAVDAAGGVYAAGWTGSSDFPVKDAIQSRFSQGLPSVGWWDHDAFLLKLSQDGQRLDWSTFLGGGKNIYPDGPGTDRAYAVALGPEGSVYLGGQTDSRDFPLVNALQRTMKSQPPFANEDGFIAKIVESQPEPALIRITRTGGSVSISWPATASGYGLEFTEGLGPTADWRAETTAPVLLGDRKVVTFEIGSGPRFFRLRKP